MTADCVKIAKEAITMIKAGSTEQRFPYWLNKTIEGGGTRTVRRGGQASSIFRH